MPIDNQLSFPVTGPDGNGTKIRITLKFKKREDGKLEVTQVEFAVGGGNPILMPDPPAGEGTPPSPPPSMEPTDFGEPKPVITSVWGEGKAAGKNHRQTRFNIICSLEPPVISMHEPIPGKDGDDDFTTTHYTINHATQDMLMEFLRNPQWVWAPKPRPAKQEEAK